MRVITGTEIKERNSGHALNLDQIITEATECINSLYPLTNFIACNALKDWEKIPFVEAMHRSNKLSGARGFLPLPEYKAMYETGRILPSDLNEAFRKDQAKVHKRSENEANQLSLSEMLDKLRGTQTAATINKQMIKWCGAYLDRTQAQWRPLSNSTTLYAFWKELACHDLAMWWHGVIDWSRLVDALPDNSQHYLVKLLCELGLDGHQSKYYLRRHIIQLPGFASHLKWRENENLEEGILADYLAIRLHYEKQLALVASKRLFACGDLRQLRTILEAETDALATHKPDEQDDDYRSVWHDAYELNYRNRLLASLRVDSLRSGEKACCQLVFCIDVRSEPIRRRLEQLGPYSTYGFAGFFGMAMRLTEMGSAVSFDLCPVLVKPEMVVSETADARARLKKISWQALKVSALQLKKKLKCNLAGAFGLVEMLGPFSALPLLAKTFAPSKTQKIWLKLESSMSKSTNSRLDLSAFSLDQKAALAEGAIKGMGLSHLCKIIVLCGHRSSSFNNPFASSLDCGACGGNGGGYNARLAAEILNDREVRERLASKGIEIPGDTVFIAAEHDTTTDEFRFFDSALTGEHEIILAKLKRDVTLAGESLRAARAASLPKSCFTMLNDPLQRAFDWAQIAPEWGLAGNAAFIAAPRSISTDADLEGRAFLHSYEYSLDTDSKVLELIMTAPLVVAQWINMQYYLSTVDNGKFGSGSKVVHNVIGDFGVMQGGESDLRIGLPLQSIMTADKLQHEPMRLLALIRAPLNAIDDVLLRHPEVSQLVSNKWIRLVALNPSDASFYEADDVGDWQIVNPISFDTTSEVADGPANACRAN